MDGTLRDELTAVLRTDGPVDLGRGALTIARIGHPDLDPTPWLERLDALAAELGPSVVSAGGPADRARALVGALAALGFRGNQDDYYEPRNSFLNDVLDRRLGIPISLSILAIELGRRCDVRLTGVSFPGHFLLGAGEPDAPIHLDPFHGGIEVDDGALVHRLRLLARQAGRPVPEFTSVPAEFLAPAAEDAILARVLRNLVRIYVERANDAHALAAVDLLLVLMPDGLNELRTRGLLYERLGCSASAVADFQRYLRLAPTAPDAAAIELRAAKLADVAPTLH
ncbi:MAG: transglutaminase-like domain-containing protein [Gemmatimonadota bacterium]